MKRRGRYRRGTDNGRCRHPDELVARVRERYERGAVGYERLAREFDLPRTTVRNWVDGLTRA